MIAERCRSPSSSTQEPEIKKQKLPAGNLKSSRKTNKAEDLITWRLGNWLGALPALTYLYDIFFSNRFENVSAVQFSL